MSLMVPEMSYERGYCRPECTKCSEVCPTGAIRPITKEDKSSVQIGHAVWIAANCVVNTDGVECGNCARHCPTGAIVMVPSVAGDPSSRKMRAAASRMKDTFSRDRACDGLAGGARPLPGPAERG